MSLDLQNGVTKNWPSSTQSSPVLMLEWKSGHCGTSCHYSNALHLSFLLWAQVLTLGFSLMSSIFLHCYEDSFAWPGLNVFVACFAWLHQHEIIAIASPLPLFGWLQGDRLEHIQAAASQKKPSRSTRCAESTSDSDPKCDLPILFVPCQLP